MSTYTIAATGPNETHIMIARDGNGLSREAVSDLTPEQSTAYAQAKQLVERNDADYRDEACAFLATCFDEVTVQP